MPTKIIRQPEHVDALAELLKGRKLPLTVSWSQGAPRSGAQNRLAQQWFTDIARQLGDQTHEDVRAECKLVFGIPILRAENDAIRATYDKSIRHLPYEEKLELIKVLDIPVTRLMTVKQMTQFMEAIQQNYNKQGVILTDPEKLKYEQEFE